MTKTKEKFIDHSDPLKCQTKPRLGYSDFFEDAERREKEGEQSIHCATCNRWRWADELCPQSAVSVPQPQETDL